MCAADALQLRGKRCLMVVQRVIAEQAAHHCRLGIGQRIDRHFAMRVAQHHRSGRGAHRAADGQPGTLEHARAKTETVGAVVIARDHDHRNPQLDHQTGQRDIEQAHRIGGRHRAVVDIPCNQDCIGADVIGQTDEVLQHPGLILQQRQAVIDPAQMPVGSMEKAHGHSVAKGDAECRTSIRTG
ncbi:hypothetical protein SDC9_171021 [bioreactor metagenome]|uniref:Uncharacterized protein n=1 Tax=bioreactor metagenome TaxID=1076179 RepID=A0A645G9Q2_9ZZZZ